MPSLKTQQKLKVKRENNVRWKTGGVFAVLGSELSLFSRLTADMLYGGSRPIGAASSISEPLCRRAGLWNRISAGRRAFSPNRAGARERGQKPQRLVI